MLESITNIYRSRLEQYNIENGEITKIEFFDAVAEPEHEGIKFLPLPERCEVSFTLHPTAESDIKTVLALPLSDWNGRFLGTGNGGSAGSIVRSSLDGGVARGFATANTDMGSEPDSNELCKKPERWKDFGYRATHLMTIVSKQIINAFYGEEPKYSYFLGSSSGGQQGVMESQRYPEDYNGIVAFSPAYNRVNVHNSFLWYMQVMSDPECAFTKEQIKAVIDRIIDSYAEASGSAKGDRFLSYPGKIAFQSEDSEKLLKGLGLSKKQISAFKRIHTMPISPLTNKQIFSPEPIGCEEIILSIPYIQAWFDKILNFPTRWVYGENYDNLKYDFQKDYIELHDALSADCDATDYDLSAYKAHGGRFILITGSSDSLIPYTDGKNYYENVLKAMGGIDNVTDFFRYFHVPGLGHGFGGNGLQEIGNLLAMASMNYEREYDALSAMIAWVEEGIAPEVLYPAAFVDGDMKKEVDFVRPVYPYPYETEYVGGDRKKKESFRRKLGNGVY